MMTKRWGLLALAALPAVLRAEPTVDQRLKVLEDKQAVLEQKAAEQPVVTTGKDGFGWKSADGAYQIKLMGDIQADSRFFLDDNSQSLTDTFVMRRVHTSVEVNYQNFITMRIMPNFGQGLSLLEDAFIEAKFNPMAKLRFGRFKPALGIENLRSSMKLTFIERALPTNLVPLWDNGIQLAGERGRIGYALSLTNGSNDASSSDTDTTDRKEFTGRIYMWPLKNGPKALAGLLLGLSGSSGKIKGTAGATTSGLPVYRTETLNTVFTYSATAFAAGTRERLNPQLTWNYGPLALLAEQVSGHQEVSTSTAKVADLTHRAWTMGASFVLTGEEALPQGGVKPKRPFELGKEGWGAWEVAARVSQWRADDATFPTYASPASSVREIRSYTTGLNWHLTTYLKAQLNYDYSRFHGGATTGDRPVERAIFTRVQVTF